MRRCSQCGRHISRIDARIGAEMSGQADENVICPTCVVTLGLLASPTTPNDTEKSPNDGA